MTCCHEHHEHHDHKHSHDNDKEALKYSLYGRIDFDNVRTLNEIQIGAGAMVLKPYHQRLDRRLYVDSFLDESLIIFIPFTGSVKLKSISIWGGPGEASPATMKAFTNREDVDFDTVKSMGCVQEWGLPRNTAGAIEYNTRLTKFSSIRNLTLYFADNYGGDETRIYYIGLKGEWSEIKEDPIITEYELFAKPSKFKNVKSKSKNQSII